MVSYLNLLRETVTFAFHPKWWLALFVLNVAVVGAVMVYMAANPEAAGGAMALLTNPAAAALTTALPGLAILGLLFVVWIVGGFWVLGAYLYHTGGVRYREGFVKAGRRLPWLAALFIILGLLQNAAGLLFQPADLYGYLIVLVISGFVTLLFGMAVPALTVGNRGLLESFKDSVALFSEHPLGVLLVQAVAITGSLALGFVFLFIGNSVVLPTMGQLVVGEALVENGYLPLLFLVMVLGMLGLAMGQAFSLKLQSGFYLSVMKKGL